MRRAAAGALGLVLAWAAASPVAAQAPVLVLGQVRDALTDEPVPSVVITAGDADRSVFTDSLGNFAIQAPGPAPYFISAVRVGYQPETFELPDASVSVVSVLALEPAILLGRFVAADDRVRIASPEVSGEFRVARVRTDALLVRQDPPTTVLELPTTSLLSLEVHRGKATSGLQGFFGGALIGGLLGGVLGVQCIQTHYDCVAGMSLQTSTVLGASLGAAVGLVVSRLGGDVWEEVRLPNSRSEDDVLATRFGAELDVMDLGQAIGMTVRNRTPGPINAYAWWEGAGNSVSLGVVGPNSTRTFRAGYRSSGVALLVEAISDSGDPADILSRDRPGTLPGDAADPLSADRLATQRREAGGVTPRNEWLRPSRFILVAEGDRLEWTVLRTTSGIVEDYVRLGR